MKNAKLIICGASVVLGFVACDKKFEAEGTKAGSTVDRSFEFKGQDSLGNSCVVTQSFKASSHREANQMLCDKLMDHNLNKSQLNSSCAEDLRKREFLLKCPGRAWKSSAPVAKPSEPWEQIDHVIEASIPNSALKVNKASKSNVADMEVSEIDEVKNELQFLTVISGQVNESQNPNHKQYAEQFMNEAESCNMGHLGPWCPTHQLIGIESDLISGKNIKTLIVEAQRADSNTREIYIFKLSKDTNVDFELHHALKERNEKQSLTNFITEKSNTIKTLDLKLEKVTKSSALNLLQNSKTLRQLLAGAMMYRDINIQEGTDSVKVSATVVKSILKNKTLAGTAMNWQDENETLNLMEGNGANSHDVILLAKEIKKSSLESSKQVAAVRILTLNPKAKEELPLVWDALKHESPDIRASSVRALIASKIKTDEDKNKLIEMLKDQDDEVRLSVIENIKLLNLNDEQKNRAMKEIIARGGSEEDIQ